MESKGMEGLAVCPNCGQIVYFPEEFEEIYCPNCLYVMTQLECYMQRVKNESENQEGKVKAC